jgi:transposase-like protein
MARLYDDWVVDVVRTMYADGFSTWEIAAELDIPQATILYWLDGRARSPAEGQRLAARPWRGKLAGREEELVRARDAGASIAATSRRFGVGASAVAYRWKTL